LHKINRLQSFQFAFAGIWYTLKTQRNAQIHLCITLLVMGLGLLLKLTLAEWATLALTTGFVIAAEMLNTAIEAAMDHATTDFHPQVKVVKDVAAGAVLVAAITAVVVGLFILGPRLLEIEPLNLPKMIGSVQ
jgi:diacylglycerol kinase